jgi:hypothetical protein
MTAMTPTAVPTAPTPAANRTPGLLRAAGWASLVQGLLLFVPVVVLGGAINWPASLGDPASAMLPALAANEAAVRSGYIAYLLYSVLFGVTVALLLRLVEHELSPAARRIAVGFAVASVVARCLGIVRWLAPMPVLADAWAATSDEGERYALARVYDVVNAWGGTIGEALGVGLFAGLSLAVLAAGLLRSRAVPRALALGAVVAAAAVTLNAVELAGVELGPLVTVTVTVVQLWFIAVGIWLLRTARRPVAR